MRLAAASDGQGTSTPARRLRIVILGLSITSAWGNGHATTYRALVAALAARGHDVLFLERDVPWYAANRDLPEPPFGQTRLYQDLAGLRQYEDQVRQADLVIVGSYVPEGVAAGDWVARTAQGVRAFYDIDTPVTMAKLRAGDYEYLEPRQIANYDLYLSFAGGPILEQIEREYGAPAARPLYCSVDPALYYPEERPLAWDLGYMGTYSPDRQPGLERLLIEPARQEPALRFVVAGPSYPDDLQWPQNVERLDHLPPDRHRAFYNSQRFTLNLTRAAMVEAGFSPSVRLFEAAACATPIISDYWPGLESLFALGSELLVARSARDVLVYLQDLPEQERLAIGRRAYEVVMSRHTADHRAAQLESYVADILSPIFSPHRLSAHLPLPGE
ncbi:MAG TPA: glycosyltransferase [Caldilineaceae bacterium]|nr:glycosyltransferase [Caldilineaceae bacterium]